MLWQAGSLLLSYQIHCLLIRKLRSMCLYSYWVSVAKVCSDLGLQTLHPTLWTMVLSEAEPFLRQVQKPFWRQSSLRHPEHSSHRLKKMQGSFFSTETFPPEAEGESWDSRSKQKVICLGQQKLEHSQRPLPCFIRGVNAEGRDFCPAEEGACKPCGELQGCSSPVLGWPLRWRGALSHHLPIFLLETPIKMHWFIRLDVGEVLTLVCCEFPFWTERNCENVWKPVTRQLCVW